MTTRKKTQVTLRLPNDVVALLDDLVAAGAADSRAEAVATMVSRDHQRQLQDRDAAIYAAEALKEPTEDEKSYRAWLRTRRYPPLDDTDWEAVTAASASGTPDA